MTIPTSHFRKITALCKRRGFIFQTADIYGGLNGVYDAGPFGVLTQTKYQCVMDAKEDTRVSKRFYYAHGRFITRTTTDVGCRTAPERFHAARLRGVPSQFNEHWAGYPAVFDRFAKRYTSGAPMPAELCRKLRRAEKFNQGYELTELLAAAPTGHAVAAASTATDAVTDADTSRRQRSNAKIALATVLRATGRAARAHLERRYAAGYYAYLWSEMLDDNASPSFEEQWRFDARQQRSLPLDGAVEGIYRGSGQDALGVAGREPSAGPMLKQHGLVEEWAGR